MKLTAEQIIAKGRKQYIADEVAQAIKYAERGKDGHGRKIVYKEAYINKTRENAKLRYARAVAKMKAGA